jgi:hypothetical protein
MCNVFLPPFLPYNLPHLANCVRCLPPVPQFHAALRFGAENPEDQAKRDDKGDNEIIDLFKEYRLKALESDDLARTPDWHRRRRLT